MTYPPQPIPLRQTGEVIQAEHVNLIKAALDDIIAVLGADPAGETADILARLAIIEEALDIGGGGGEPPPATDTYTETYQETY